MREKSKTRRQKREGKARRDGRKAKELRRDKIMEKAEENKEKHTISPTRYEKKKRKRCYEVETIKIWQQKQAKFI